GAQGGVRGLSGVRRHQPAVQMQDSRAFVRAPPGDGFPEPWAHAGRHHGDPRLARYCVRGNRPVINLSGPIRDECLTPDRVTTPEDMRNSAAPLIWWPMPAFMSSTPRPSLAVRDSTLVAWYRSLYAPRTGGAYDGHHRTAGVTGRAWRRCRCLAARGERTADGDAGGRV